MNWSIALIATCISIISFGMDQVIIKKIATGVDINEIATLHLAHVFLTGTGFYILLIGASFIFPSFFTQHPYLTGFAISLILIYYSSPFKQIAHGKEWFHFLTIISICSNLVKVLLLLAAILIYKFSVSTVIIIYIIASVVELVMGILLVKSKFNIVLHWQFNKKKYTNLIKESLPQLAVIIFNSGIARFDWIILGLMTSAAITAEYTFAYRVFELAAFPLLIIAPVLLPRISRYLVSHDRQLKVFEKEFLLLLKLEMIVACIIPLALNFVWADLLNPLTDNKYGSTNATVFLLLSVAIPLLYLNNFFWTIAFAGGKMKKIISNFTVTFLINIIGGIILIPLMKGEGAAIAYLMAIIVQSVLFVLAGKKDGLEIPVRPLIIALTCAIASFVLVSQFSLNPPARLLTGIFAYLFLVAATGLIQRTDFKVLKQLLQSS